MSDYFIYYFEANMVCFILFGIMLTRDLLSRDRQERQIKYDHALIAFMAYFVSDTIWAAVIAGILPSNRFTVLTINFANYVAMAMISFMWLRFVMAVENIPNREKKANKFFILLPHIALNALKNNSKSYLSTSVPFVSILSAIFKAFADDTLAI